MVWLEFVTYYLPDEFFVPLPLLTSTACAIGGMALGIFAFVKSRACSIGVFRKLAMTGAIISGLHLVTVDLVILLMIFAFRKGIPH